MYCEYRVYTENTCENSFMPNASILYKICDQILNFFPQIAVICVLDKLHSLMSYSGVGHQFNVNE